MSSLVAADLHQVMPAVRADLERLIRIPSIAFDGYPEAPVREMLRRCMMPSALRCLMMIFWPR